MDQIRITGTNHTTSRMGFGCAHLIGVVSWRKSLALLECAYENGIRHFDVAPMYGFAEAEKCLGAFLKRHACDTTVTTKFGILPGKRQSLFRAVRSLSRPLLKPLKGIFLPKSITVPKTSLSMCFDVDLAAKSLDKSLLNLKTDHVHIFLLHEVANQDIKDDRLLRFLEDAVSAGKIGTFGVGSDAAKISELVQHRPEYCRVTQYQSSLVDVPKNVQVPFQIHHGIFNERLMNFCNQLQNDAAKCKKWSDLLGCDVFDITVLSGLICRATLLSDPKSIILMSSTSLERIARNCRYASDKLIDNSAKKFHQLLMQSHL